MHYSFREIDSYGTPIRLVYSRRGLGKTFGAKLKGFYSLAVHNKRFIYVTDTLESVKELSRNRGEKFFANLMQFIEEGTTRRTRKIREAISGLGEAIVEEDELVAQGREAIKSGVIKLGKKTCGYIIALNDFAKMKRNDFAEVRYVIIDEFIPETMDVRTLDNPRKLVSIIQTIARTNDIIIYMLANSIRLSDPILMRLGLDNMKPGEKRVIKDKYGPLLAAHYVSNDEYPEFSAKADASVAGRFAALLKEDNLDKNEFRETVPNGMLIPEPPKQSHFEFCIHGEMGSIRIHATQDHKQYYVFSDYGRNKRCRYCLDMKYASPVVKYYPDMKELLFTLYERGNIFFDGSTTYIIFKSLLKLDIK